jgi:hypothetical protein
MSKKDYKNKGELAKGATNEDFLIVQQTIDDRPEKKVQIRNSTHDFLVFSKENGGDGVDVLVASENVWLTQKSMCSLYDTAKSNVSEHLTTIFQNGELDENSTVRNFRTVASNGKEYNQKYYNLRAKISLLEIELKKNEI